MSEAIAENIAASPPGEMVGDETATAIPQAARLQSSHWWDALGEASKFVKRLETLREVDRGKIAALRRNAGNTLGQARGVAWIEGWLDGAPREHDEQFFLVATLFDLNREHARTEDFGASMKRVSESASDSFERRFLTLLDAEYDLMEDALDGAKKGGGEVAYRLRAMTRLAASKNVGIHWPILLADLCCWEMPGKPVQKKWARNFYAPQLTIIEGESTPAATEPTTGEKTDAN